MKPLLQPNQLHEYQRECVMHQLQHDDSMLWLQMGLGKTPITLTTIIDRMRAGHVKKTLIFGPLRVIQAVWHREARKWEHTKHLRFSVIHGTRDKKERALFADADVYLCNYENMNWLAEQLIHYYISQDKPIPFDFVVYDEVSKMKNSTTKRMGGGTRDVIDKWGAEQKVKIHGWRKIIPHFKYRTGLTGTPASNGYLDLFGQFLAVDGGERLGEFVTHFKDSYFVSDHMGWSYVPSKQGKEWIEYKISDITKKMDAIDYLDMPEVTTTNVMVELPAKARKAYKEMEANLFTMLETGSEVEVFSKNSISNKCLQFCNGSPYLSSESPEFEALHDAKLDALDDILEEAAGSPVLCSYTYKSDAARIMHKFKKLKPVNLTETPSSQTEAVIDQWNRGEIKLLVGHPACLHPDTQVLTEREGWVRIVDVRKDDLVFDGIEYVPHDGCMYAGHKEVIDVFGITMTPDHKLWINDEWVEGHHVDVSEEGRREAEFKWQNENDSSGEVQPLWPGADNSPPEHGQTQQEQTDSLQTVQISPVDQHANMADMVGDEEPRKRPHRQKLRRSWYRNQRGVVELREFLRRYVGGLLGRSDDRTGGCEWPLLQGELHMGDDVGATKQQAEQPNCDVSRGSDTPRGVVSEIRVQQNDANHEAQPGHDGGRSGTGCCEVEVREEFISEECEASGREKEHVYDLVNCGPRHRFLVRNSDGEMFIAKNSMGHGIDGLQDSGSIMVWFGMNWSLELYEQMCGRLNRQGQTQPVSIIRILCNDTVDLAVADAIERKTDDQEGLKSALQRYRDGHTTNELEVNFF